MSNQNTNEAKKNKGTKYPMEVGSVVRGKETLSVTAALSVASTKDGQKPLMVFHEDFSLYKFTVINSGVAANANVKVKEIANIRELTRIAQRMDVESKMAPVPKPDKAEAPAQTATTAQAEGPAFSVKISEGKYKGNTPAQILIADSGATKDMNELYLVLKKKAKEDPEHAEAYREEMAAIADAANRMKQGTLVPDTTDTDIAYSVKFGTGRLKGKTAAEVLMESGEQVLMSHRKFLSDHLKDYSGNQKQIDAIDAAMKLKKAGLLQEKKETATERQPANGRGIILFEALYRSLIRKASPDGIAPVYDIRITWYLGQEYPVEIQIDNYKAPVVQRANGTLNVSASKANQRISNKVLLTAVEWNHILDTIQMNMEQFALLHAKECFNDALATDRANLAAANVKPVKEA